MVVYNDFNRTAYILNIYYFLPIWFFSFLVFDKNRWVTLNGLGLEKKDGEPKMLSLMNQNKSQ